MLEINPINRTMVNDVFRSALISIDERGRAAGLLMGYEPFERALDGVRVERRQAERTSDFAAIVRHVRRARASLDELDGVLGVAAAGAKAELDHLEQRLRQTSDVKG